MKSHPCVFTLRLTAKQAVDIDKVRAAYYPKGHPLPSRAEYIRWLLQWGINEAKKFKGVL